MGELVPTNEVVLNALQGAANEGGLPVARVTGFTLCLEGVTDDGQDMILTITSPFDYIIKSAGHITYLDETMRTNIRDRFINPL